MQTLIPLLFSHLSAVIKLLKTTTKTTMSKLYYYWDMDETADWAKNPLDFRTKNPDCNKAHCIRASHMNVSPPKGWHKPNGYLACDAIEKIPTMKDLINAL